VDLPKPEKPLAEMAPEELQEWRMHLITTYYELITNPRDRRQLMVACGYTKMAHLYSAANKHGATNRRGARGQVLNSEAHDPTRLSMREDPSTTVFTEYDDEYLRSNFGQRRSLEEIALATQHSEIAMAYRARHLGLRHFCKYWPLEKVLGWTGMSREELEKYGMLTYAVIDEKGKVRITLASSSSLSRMVADPIILPLMKAAGCDLFFLQELAELWDANRRGDIYWEISCWISHGHTCLNPRSGEAFCQTFSGRDASDALKIKNIDARPFDITAGVSTWRTPLESLGIGIEL
jgi:hypothetical protein